ncbi:hypothetical protein ScPMuIL_002036 [Solemya velum]
MQGVGSVCLSLRYYRPIQFLVLILAFVFYCEFLHYFLVLLWCQWPVLDVKNEDSSVPSGYEPPLKVMILADTHLLGPRKGHWFDKLRREWQMYRAFQSSLAIHSPEAVFVLGDVLDEGMWESGAEFQKDISRFQRMFKTSHNVPQHVLVGNHDIGFHYMMSEEKHKRFEKAFDTPSAKLLRIRNNIFVLVNSMTMEGDSCKLCSEAVNLLKDISWQLKCSQGAIKKMDLPQICETIETFPYTKPILLQHFPMYRLSDSNCSLPDAAPDSEKDIPFRLRIDCLTEEATNQLFDWINPRLVIDGHTHHGCYRVHDNGVPEWTVASFNWRNKRNPTFLLAVFSNNNFAVSQCFLPNEFTVISIYIFGGVFLVFTLLCSRHWFGRRVRSSKSL